MRDIVAGLESVAEKIRSGMRLNRSDGLTLLRTTNFPGLGYLANEKRHAFVGDRVFFNNNAHINYSNVCKLRCGFCAFSKDPGEKGSYTMTISEIVERAQYFAGLGAREIHVVGGIHPNLPFSYYLDIVSSVKKALPDVSIKAFTAAEYDYFAQMEKCSVAHILQQMKEVGLDFIPGGGAENFSPRVRQQICPDKLRMERWLEIHRTAHRLGIPSNANMLFGITETDEELIDHLLTLRALQDKTGGFYALVPTAFHPENTKFSYVRPSTAWKQLKVTAVARLLLDNFRYIKAYCVSAGVSVAQLALSFGANDLDGVVQEEKIYHTAGASSPKMMTTEELIRLIHEADLTAVERDTHYNVLKIYSPESMAKCTGGRDPLFGLST